MFILYTKRQGRKIAEGKKTIVYKDDRVSEDSRLDRFGERNFLDEDASTYLNVGILVCGLGRPRG